MIGYPRSRTVSELYNIGKVAISSIRYYILLVVAYFKYILQYVFDKFVDYPWETKVAFLILVVCSTLIIIIWASLLVASIREKRKHWLHHKMEQNYGKGMDYILSSEASELLSRAQIAHFFDLDVSVIGKSILNGKHEKAAFVDLFYTKFITQRSESSRMENIHKMLGMFEIPEFLEKEVSHGNMKRKVLALNKIRPFKLPLNTWVVNTLLNSRYLHVQRLAMYSTIMSSSDSSLEYFETDFFDKHCCIKDEIELAYSLQRRRKEGLKLPNLARWAHIQKNEKAQCMFVRLMRRFNEVEYCGQLTDLFGENKKKKLIEEIARTWGYLHYTECEDLLIEALLTQADDTKVAIMHAMTRLATGKSLNALLEGFANTTNPHVRYEALRCIYNYGAQGRKLFKKLESEATEADKKYFAFFNNPITLEKVRLDREQAYHPSVETVFNG